MTLKLEEIIEHSAKLNQLDITKWENKSPPELERESKPLTTGVFKSAKSSFKGDQQSVVSSVV